MAYKTGLGYEVYRAATAIAITVSPGQPWFTVTGLVLMTALLGQWTATPGGANNLSFELSPTAAGVGTPFIMCAAADLGSTAILGAVFALVGAAGTALPANVGGAISGLTMGGGILLSAGPIGLVATGNVGQFRTWLYYVPIMAGSRVVTAP
jgi:hypothetical protein